MRIFRFTNRQILGGLAITMLLLFSNVACGIFQNKYIEDNLIGQWSQSDGNKVAKFSTIMKFEKYGKGSVTYKGSVSFLGVGGELGNEAPFKWEIKESRLYLNFDKPEASNLHNTPLTVTFQENRLILVHGKDKTEVFDKVAQ